MSVPRIGFSATLLRNGKVLVVGGENLKAEHGLATSELYDPQSNTWTSGASMHESRAGQTATLLDNGEVLVAGGSESKQAELYDPGKNFWKPAGTMIYPCAAAFATLVRNDNVLISGCNTTPQLYNTSTNSWSAAGKPPAALRAGGATLLSTGEVLLLGGFNDDLQGDSSYAQSAAAEVYAPATNAWRSVRSMSVGRSGPTVAALPGGDVLVAGGATGGYGEAQILSSAELYDPSTNSWSATASMSVGRVAAASARLPSGNVLVAGGINAVNPGNGNPTAPPLASAEIYSPASRSWSVVPDMSAGRSEAAAVLLPSGKVLVVGGISGFGSAQVVLASAEIYGR
jgi:N-acetylneuraminic acid mutarotase